jgi:chromosome segregation ATPase
MAEPNEIIKTLNERLIALSRKQDDFYREINALRQEIARLSLKEQAEVKEPVIQTEEKQIEETVQPPVVADLPPQNPVPPNSIPQYPYPQNYPRATARQSKSELERFIGENLINKIGDYNHCYWSCYWC